MSPIQLAQLRSQTWHDRAEILPACSYEAIFVREWLAMLKEIAPGLERVALLANPKRGRPPYGYRSRSRSRCDVARDSARSRRDGSDIERAMKSFAASRRKLLLPPDGTTILVRDLLIVSPAPIALRV